MELKIAKMTFERGVRFGTPGIELEACEEICRSDTLFSGLVHAWSELFGEKGVRELLNALPRDGSAVSTPPFTLSSAFLYSGNQLFLPKPLSGSPGLQNELILDYHRKDLHRASYLPVGLFKDWVNGNAIDSEQFLESQRDYRAAFSQHHVPHVALDRVTESGAIYHSAYVTFADRCGLWCLVAAHTDSWSAKLGAAFRLLGEKGLGGDRSSGLGGFRLDGDDLQDAPAELQQLFGANEPGAYVTLSLFNPTDSELAEIKNNGADGYGLIRRKGWVSSPQAGQPLKRQSVFMFTEGSVFARAFHGRLIDVTPEIWKNGGPHPVYRNGLALMIPMRSEGGVIND